MRKRSSSSPFDKRHRRPVPAPSQSVSYGINSQYDSNRSGTSGTPTALGRQFHQVSFRRQPIDPLRSAVSWNTGRSRQRAIASHGLKGLDTACALAVPAEWIGRRRMRQPPRRIHQNGKWINVLYADIVMRIASIKFTDFQTTTAANGQRSTPWTGGYQRQPLAYRYSRIWPCAAVLRASKKWHGRPSPGSLSRARPSSGLPDSLPPPRWGQ